MSFFNVQWLWGMFDGTFFVFHNSVETLCVSWALSLVECVAVWAPKLPVPHTDVLKTHSSQSFSTQLLESKGTGSKQSPTFLRLFGVIFILFLFFTTPQPACIPLLPGLPFPKEKSKKKSPEKLYLQRKYPAFWGILFIFQLTATESTIFARPNLLVPC